MKQLRTHNPASKLIVGRLDLPHMSGTDARHPTISPILAALVHATPTKQESLLSTQCAVGASVTDSVTAQVLPLKRTPSRAGFHDVIEDHVRSASSVREVENQAIVADVCVRDPAAFRRAVRSLRHMVPL
jgi:hypothetical protein